MSSAARRARSGSSSRTMGTPNAAMIASPMYFSTVPPHDSMRADMAEKKAVRSDRSRSGSRRSPSAVDPVTSANKMVTSLRSSSRTPAEPGPRSVPQLGQKRAERATGVPHDGQGRTSAAPHVGQKVADSRTGEPQDQQFAMVNYGP